MRLLDPVPGRAKEAMWRKFDIGELATLFLLETRLVGRSEELTFDELFMAPDAERPAIATALLGILAGKWITSGASSSKKVLGLIGAGVVMIVLGWCWHPFFPIIKKIWSSSFVLVAGGWSAVLLGLFIALPLVVAGARKGRCGLRKPTAT